VPEGQQAGAARSGSGMLTDLLQPLDVRNLMLIRAAVASDLAAILAIYNDVIEHSTAVYCDDPVSLSDREQWFAGRMQQGYPVLVAEVEGQVVGYASFGDFRGYPGFRYTVEHSVHLSATCRGQGIGSALLMALLPLARKLGKHVMVAGIDASNQGSIRFHQRLGFSEVGRMPEVGFKFGRWLDLVLMQRSLCEPD
jgi:L-amino acid N-acyltransferase YncA